MSKTKNKPSYTKFSQYGGDGIYNLISRGKKVNCLQMNRKDAKERNRDRKLHGHEPHWWWSGK